MTNEVTEIERTLTERLLKHETLRPELTVRAPQHVEYELTDLGHTLEKPLAAICDWAATQAPPH